ncbi:hypothetical protein AB1Y20_001975 [Prymnesium parvum]|uniref:Uncharacterized protein n=1 Tax=Prymnesium parvum TaxID=97485 RepID=A0AB34J7Q3_PRYPA
MRTVARSVAMALIGTHSGCFQADEALGVWLLRRLDRFGGASASVVRSRDPAVLEGLPLLLDVGGIYSHEAQRYDHHQRGFFETFDGAVGAATGPENATGKFKTKLSASGLVYKHYGREILCALHPQLQLSPGKLEWVYTKMYTDFMEAIDGNDNGVEIADAVRYRESTALPHRVHRLNARWNDPPGGPSEDERFEQASALCGEDFSSMLSYVVTCELPARDIVEKALIDRSTVDSSGEVIAFANGGCPWKTHLYDLERVHGVDPLVKFVLYPDSSGMWRVQAVTVEGTSFTNRMGLLESWRGLRDAELSAAAAIEGCKFCHASGFIGGHENYEGALAMALKTIRSSS